MLQNLVNLRSTPVSNVDNSASGMPSAPSDQRFDQLLKKAQSNLQSDAQKEDEKTLAGPISDQALEDKLSELAELELADLDRVLADSETLSLKGARVAQLGLHTNSSETAQPHLPAEGDWDVHSGIRPVEANTETSSDAGHLAGLLATDAKAVAASEATMGTSISKTGLETVRSKAIPAEAALLSDKTMAASAPVQQDGAEKSDFKLSNLVSELVRSQNNQAGVAGTLDSANRGVLAAGVAIQPQKQSIKPELAATDKVETAKDLSAKVSTGELDPARIAEKELPRTAVQSRSSDEAQGQAIKLDRENVLTPGRTADAANVKPVNDLSLGNLGQPSQTLISAVKENTNWVRMLSAPTVQFAETAKPNGKVLQTLNVTLNPVELGKLELNLRMQQGQVTIDVRAESEQAYRALLVDQDALANSLRGLGFKVDSVTVSGPQSENATQFQNSAQSGDGNSADKYDSESTAQDGQLSEDLGQHSNDPSKADEENAASIDII